LVKVVLDTFFAVIEGSFTMDADSHMH